MEDDTKMRLANMLINTILYKDVFALMQDLSVKRAEEILENADDEQMTKILGDLEAFEKDARDNENKEQTKQTKQTEE